MTQPARFAVLMCSVAVLIAAAPYRAAGDDLVEITIDGDVVFGPSNPLTLQVKAPSPLFSTPVPGDDHDKLIITGSATLGGSLDLELLMPTTRPRLGTQYQVMTYGTRTIAMFPTMFSAINNVIVDTDFALAPLFTDTDLTVRATVPGDVNFDDKVSISDLSTFGLNFDTFPGRGSWHLGDFNTDGLVTVADLSLLALNFGFGDTTSDGSSSGVGLPLETVARLAGIDVSALPEPATWAMLVLPAIVIRRGVRPMTRQPVRP